MDLPTQKVELEADKPTRPERVESSLNVGAKLGRYEVLDVLGVGGGGAVYKAFDQTLKRNVALKVLHTRVGDPTRVAMLREGRALAQFSHPNVIAVYDVGEDGSAAFIAMELAEGERLDQWLRGTRSWTQVLRVFLDAGRGLAAVHGAKLVHRDFKPGNVVVRSDGRVQLIDFGIARPDAAPEGEPSVQALVSGTPGFMAPEHMRGEKPGTQSDQFSFCCALYEALLGVLPFGESADTAQLLRIEKRQLKAPPQKTKVPRRVVKVLERGLAFEAADRFPSMDELVRALSKTLPLDRVAWTGVAALSLAAGAAIGFMWLYSSTRGLGCSADIEAAEKVWSPEARAELAARQLPQRTLSRIDDYAGGLLAASKAVCTTVQRGEGSRASRLEARACLSSARRDLSSLIQALRGSHEVTAAQIEASVEAMAPASDCVSLDSAEAENFNACGQRLFDAVTNFQRGRWSLVLEGAAAAQRCATEQRATDIASAAHRLRGAVLERLGDTVGARAEGRESVKSALKSRGELLALAWLSLARLEPDDRALELLDWTDRLLESSASAPETRARAALMRLRLSPAATLEQRQALVRTAAYGGEDPTQLTVAKEARAFVDPAELDGAVTMVGQLSSPPVPALLELADALTPRGKNPEAGKTLLAASLLALPENDLETVLARCYFASAARTLGATEDALRYHARLEASLSSDAPVLMRAVVLAELSRSLQAAGKTADAEVTESRARALAMAEPELKGWLLPALSHPAP
jgi:predicted Ser/Thr protein kinase